MAPRLHVMPSRMILHFTPPDMPSMGSEAFDELGGVNSDNDDNDGGDMEGVINPERNMFF